MLHSLIVVLIENHKLNFTHLRIPYPPPNLFRSYNSSNVQSFRKSVVPRKIWKKLDPEFRIRKLDLEIILNYISYLKQNRPLSKISDWNEKS